MNIYPQVTRIQKVQTPCAVHLPGTELSLPDFLCTGLAHTVFAGVFTAVRNSSQATKSLPSNTRLY